jgi:hypothetical protein
LIFHGTAGYMPNMAEQVAPEVAERFTAHLLVHLLA